MIKTFFHYSKNIEKIEKSGYIKDISFAKTNTYDILLETCPGLILDEENIKKFRKYKKERKAGRYCSKYMRLRLRYKNSLLNEFFNQNKFVLAFDEKLPKGWIKWGMLPLLANKIGRQFLKFKITEEIAGKSFVLEQKYWSPIFSKKKFGLNTWNPQFKIEEHPKIAKEIFGKYYLSIKRVLDYRKGEYEAPEFWIHGEIPFAECEKGRISEKAFNELLKRGKMLKEVK